MDKITKSPSEYFPIAVNFANDLTSGENLDSYTLTCIDISSGESSSATVIATSSISGNVVTVVVQAGSIDDLHKITVKGTSDLGNVFEKDIYLEIKKVIAGEFTKQASDEFSIKVDFWEDIIPIGSEQGVSVSAEVLDEDGVDQAATMFSDDPFLDGEFTETVYLGIQAGSAGLYEIHVVVTTTSGYIFDIYVRMRIEEM
jgi:hypothetical protein